MEQPKSISLILMKLQNLIFIVSFDLIKHETCENKKTPAMRVEVKKLYWIFSNKKFKDEKCSSQSN